MINSTSALLGSLSITLLSFLTIPNGWVMPSVKDFIFLSMIGIFGGVANLWLSQSYKYAEVSLVTPLKYLALVFAIFFGYFIWGEIPTIKTLGGALLVIFSTLVFKSNLIFCFFKIFMNSLEISLSNPGVI